MPIIAKQPWEIVQMNWILGLPETSDRNKAILVAADCHTRYTTTRPSVEATSAATTTFFLQEITLKFGIPIRVHTDNGTHFKVEFDKLCKRWGIQHAWGTMYYSQSHGRVERTNELILSRLRRQCSVNWDRSLASALFAINSKKGRGQKHSSLELLAGTRGRGPVEVALVNELNTKWTAEEIKEIPDETMEDRVARMARVRQEHLAAIIIRAKNSHGKQRLI